VTARPAAVGGRGELWVDAAGMPRRQLLDLTLPQAGQGYAAQAHVAVELGDFGRVASLPRPVQGADGRWRLEGDGVAGADPALLAPAVGEGAVAALAGSARALLAPAVGEEAAAALVGTLAAAHAESGDFKQALEWLDKAVALDKDGTYKESFARERAAYEANKPYRDTK
jgi:hypothetical protein